MSKRIETFNIWEGNPASRLREINIVGKRIKCCRLMDGSWPLFGRVPDKSCYLKIDSTLFICFEDGDVLELSGWDETFTVSYNYLSDMEQEKNENPDPITDSVINRYIKGKRIVDSTLNGEECTCHYMYLTIELEDGIEIRLEATFQDTLDIALFRSHEDSWAENYMKGSFNKKKLAQLGEDHFISSFMD